MFKKFSLAILFITISLAALKASTVSVLVSKTWEFDRPFSTIPNDCRKGCRDDYENRVSECKTKSPEKIAECIKDAKQQKKECKFECDEAR